LGIDAIAILHPEIFFPRLALSVSVLDTLSSSSWGDISACGELLEKEFILFYLDALYLGGLFVAFSLFP